MLSQEDTIVGGTATEVNSTGQSVVYQKIFAGTRLALIGLYIFGSYRLLISEFTLE